MIIVKILADSINTGNWKRITTFKVIMPRFILPQLSKHRILSINTESSRAVPIYTKIASILKNPVVPEFWGLNKKGMQSDSEISDSDIEKATFLWLKGIENAIETARELEKLKLHKEYTNRVIESYSHIACVITSTQWTNFLTLRLDSHAQYEIRNLALAIKNELINHQPRYIKPGDLHLPLVSEKERYEFYDDIETLMALSSSRVATVSYNRSIDVNNCDIKKDVQRYKHLRDNGHWSAFEHAAIATPDTFMFGNLIGWVSHRKFFSNESGDFSMDKVEILNPHQIKEYISKKFSIEV